MVLFHIPRPASNVESQATDKWYLKTAFVRYVQPMNVSPVPWSCHPPGSLREGEKEWTILRLHQRSFPVFGLILCLRGGHEYSSKHRSSFFCSLKVNSSVSFPRILILQVRVSLFMKGSVSALCINIMLHYYTNIAGLNANFCWPIFVNVRVQV